MMRDNAQCRKCRLPYFDDEEADEFGTGLCYECFECSIEEYEERKRERIARENEY
jgi:protein-arginine kinase activator protein McsA